MTASSNGAQRRDRRPGAAINTLRGELGNPNQVAAPILKVNNNEIVADAVTSDKVKDGNITADDLANDSVVGGLGGDVKDNTIDENDLKSNSVIGGEGGDV